jgi:hypothetical protein
MPTHYEIEEPRIQRALDSIPEGKLPNYAELPRTFDCNYDKLRRRHKGMPSKMTRKITYYRLNGAQELALLQWINYMDKSFTSPTRGMIEKCANSILRQGGVYNPNEPPKVGEHWVG